MSPPLAECRPVTPPQNPRRYSWLGGEFLSNLEIDLPRDTAGFSEAFRLTHDQYVARGYMAPHPSGHRLSLYHALPSTKVFLARLNGRLSSTVTLIPDSPIGLPTDDIYGEELDALRREGRQVAEVSALATDPRDRAVGLAVLMRLLRVVLIYAAERVRLDDLFLAVNPRHADFYRRMFGFTTVGDLKHYRAVSGAPAVAMRLNLDMVRDRIDAAITTSYADRLLDFLYNRDHVAQVIRELRRKARRSVMTADQFRFFFSGQAVWDDAPIHKRALVRSFYPEPRPSHDRAAWGAAAPALSPA